MRYLVISDIHSNLPALVAVLRDCPPEAYDRPLVLGDLVGYGADPAAVIDRIRALAPHVVVRGNHDKAVCGLMDLHAFNSHARQAAEWTTGQLSEAQLTYLRDTQLEALGPDLEPGDRLLVDGRPVEPGRVIVLREVASERRASARRRAR